MLTGGLKGAAIKLAIFQSGMRQGAVAALAGMSDSGLYRTIMGRRKATRAELVRLAEVCGVEPRWLCENMGVEFELGLSQ